MLAELESRNSGKPIVEAEYDTADVATCFEYYGGLATKVMGHVNPCPTTPEPIVEGAGRSGGQIIPELPAADGGLEAGPCAGRRLPAC
jgi:betaine-aldehyde dehydrogenase